MGSSPGPLSTLPRGHWPHGRPPSECSRAEPSHDTGACPGDHSFCHLAGVETELGEVPSPACAVENGAVSAASSAPSQIWGPNGMRRGPWLPLGLHVQDLLFSNSGAQHALLSARTLPSAPVDPAERLADKGPLPRFIVSSPPLWRHLSLLTPSPTHPTIIPWHSSTFSHRATSHLASHLHTPSHTQLHHFYPDLVTRARLTHCQLQDQSYLTR